MAFLILRDHWMGLSDSEIAEKWNNLSDADEAAAVVARQAQNLATRAISGIESRAQDGDLYAVAWLEDRGLIDLPRSDGSRPRVDPARRAFVRQVLDKIVSNAVNGDLRAAAWLGSRGLIELPQIRDGLSDSSSES